MQGKWLYGMLMVLLLGACTNEDPVHVDYNDIKDPLIDENKSAAQIENEQIDGYVKRYNLDVVKTGTGIRYQVYEKGEGQQAEEGMLATVNFKISLIDGTVCYSSDSTGSYEFLIGMDEVESGLHESMTYLHEGDKAIIILPSHRAHGLVGDDQRIPPRSTVIYDIELLGLRHP